ncbi:putative disease resistance protein RGA1 [Dioscorea cayenensis subsp. rotundata]|uniref:Disease resistance protein RGA1 n=1 Tax=Dioscorea cayennensis subsp. rotundata TaxID=55577 RepID=A0AB40BHZ9_DIOCR|nr:putative disease resistance protein RGA1 [Dioscorea cayenensis subsp. rotundata]
MVGTTAVSEITEILFKKLPVAALDEYQSLRNAQKEFQYLSSTLSSIQDLLEDAEEKQLNDKLVKGWLLKRKDVAVDTDDLLDKHTTAVQRSKLKDEKRKASQVGENWEEDCQQTQGIALGCEDTGSMLYSKLGEDEWNNILRSEIWELPTDQNNIMPALRLSYKHLPQNLKNDLVQMWMALGFIQPQGRKRMEDVGYNYFDELVSKSFFQAQKGNYVIHDAVHDLARSISIDECVRLKADSQNFYKQNYMIDMDNALHLSFSCRHSVHTSFEPFYRCERLRTLLLLQGYESKTNIPSSLFIRLKFLRVLVLNRQDIQCVPDSIGNLLHLRYLGLSSIEIKMLPPSISKLYNLQTLRLKHCNELMCLPRGITGLSNLRHLEANILLTSEIAGIGKLTYLQKLAKFTVRQRMGFHITELKDMTELRGRLCISDLENDQWRRELQSPPSLGQLPFLRYLDIGGMDSVTHIGKEFLGVQGFPSLIELVIEDMPCLEEWAIAQDGVFPCITKIRVRDCPELRELPQLPPTLTKLTPHHQHQGRNQGGLAGASTPPQLQRSLYPAGGTNGLSILFSPSSPSTSRLQPLQLPRRRGEVGAFLVAVFFHHLCPLAWLLHMNILWKRALRRSQQHGQHDHMISLTTKPHNIKHLKISDYFELNYFPKETRLPDTLKLLTLCNCANLLCLPPLLHVSGLETLVITNCPLAKLPVDGLPAELQELHIDSCLDDVKEWDKMTGFLVLYCEKVGAIDFYAEKIRELDKRIAGPHDSIMVLHAGRTNKNALKVLLVA